MFHIHETSINLVVVLLLAIWPTLVNGQVSCANFAPPLIIQGKQIYNSITKEYVPIKGVNYYPRPNAGSLTRTNSVDFVTEEFRSVWERDIEYFKQLNVNVIRLYAVEPGQNHDGFMCALRAAGIYVIVGLAADCENCAVTRVEAPACYPAELKERGQFIIGEFARYDNVLGFSAGNEISLSSGSVNVNGACQKQFIRDMRSYVKGCSETIRQIPIGLAVADIEREEKALWYSCRSDPSDDLENAEFIGLNSYLHCDGSLSDGDPLLGFEMLLEDFERSQTPVPVLLTEFGCVDSSFESGQRDFRQVDVLFSERYRQEFVGGVVFEYSTESINSVAPYPFNEYGEGNFGLGHFAPETCDDIETPCQFSPFAQFNELAAKYAAVDTSSEPPLSDLPSQGQFPVCPAQFPSLSSFEWPSSTLPDRKCPGKVYVTCPGVPDECTGLGVPFQAAPPTTLAPQTSGAVRQGSKAPTASPQVLNLNASNTATPTTIPVVGASPAQMVTPTDSPTAALGVTLLTSQTPTRAGATESPTLAPGVRSQIKPSSTQDALRPSFSPIVKGDPTGGADDPNEESSAVSWCFGAPLLSVALLLSLGAVW